MNIPLVKMNVIENLLVSWGLFIGIVFFHWWICREHPNARRTQEVVEEFVKGSGINALFWSMLLGVAFMLGESNRTLWDVIALVLETRILFVPWAIWSLVVIPLAFAIDEHSRGQIDYRVSAIVMFSLLTLVLGFYYYSIGIPMNPISFP